MTPSSAPAGGGSIGRSAHAVAKTAAATQGHSELRARLDAYGKELRKIDLAVMGINDGGNIGGSLLGVLR